MKSYNALLVASLSFFSSGSIAANDANAEIKIGMFKCGLNSEMRCPHLWFKTTSGSELIQNEKVSWMYQYGNDEGYTSAKIIPKDIAQHFFAEKMASNEKLSAGGVFKVTKVCMDKVGFCWVAGNEGDAASDGHSSEWVTYELVSQNYGTALFNDDSVNSDVVFHKRDRYEIESVREPKTDSFSASLAPPKRPDSFRTPEELQAYLKELNEYYAIVGRPR